MTVLHWLIDDWAIKGFNSNSGGKRACLEVYIIKELIV